MCWLGRVLIGGEGGGRGTGARGAGTVTCSWWRVRMQGNLWRRSGWRRTGRATPGAAPSPPATSSAPLCSPPLTIANAPSSPAACVRTGERGMIRTTGQFEPPPHLAHLCPCHLSFKFSVHSPCHCTFITTICQWIGRFPWLRPGHVATTGHVPDGPRPKSRRSIRAVPAASAPLTRSRVSPQEPRGSHDNSRDGPR